MNPPEAEPICCGCGRRSHRWITTCPTCERPIDNGMGDGLEAQAARPIRLMPSFVDIPVSADEPAKVALLLRFLVLYEFHYEEYARLVSVPAAEAGRLAEAIDQWALAHELPDDKRHVDTLASTVRELATTVIGAVAAANPGALPDGLTGASLDLR